MDDKDRLLITILSKDARRPIVALARDLGLSRSAAQERLAKLVASGSIAKFTIVEGKEGEVRQTAHLLIRLEKGFKCAQVVPKIRSIPIASAIHSIAGDYDIILRLDASGVSEIEAARAGIVTLPGVASVITLMTLQRHAG